MKYKICFVSPGSYPLLQEKSGCSFIGGSELQQVLLGNSLKKEGHDVSFVTCIWGGKTEDECFNGIRIFKAYEVGAGIPFLRLIYPVYFRIWNAMKRADADVYYQRGGYYITAIVALFCKINKRIFLFSGAHDENFIKRDLDFKKVSSWRYTIRRLIFMWGVKSSSHVLAQSSRQKEYLKGAGVESSVAYNFYLDREITRDEKKILWVGNIKSFKRPFIFLEIAKKFIHNQFIMIGGCSKKEPDLYREILNEASKMSNVQFLGYQPWEETEKIFDSASLFINTSEMEGFPNTFLQAWARGIPTISFLDIDDLIKRHRLGSVVGSLEEVEMHLEKLLNLSQEERKRIRDYCATEHSSAKYIQKIESAINKNWKRNQSVTEISY